MHVPTNAPFLKPLLRFYWGWQSGNECSVLAGVGSLFLQEMFSLELLPTKPFQAPCYSIGKMIQAVFVNK